MKKTLMIFSALVAPTVAFSQDGPRPISLAEAVTLARKNAPSMIQARGQIRTSNSALRVAKWAYFPLNQLQFGYSSSTGGGASIDDEGFLRTRPASEWSFGQSYGGASLTLWDGGTKLGNIKIADARVDAAEIGELNASFTIAQQVKAQYYSILQSFETESNAQKQLEQNQFLMGLARARVRGGTANVIDTLNTLVQINNTQLTILQARNTRAFAVAQLTRLTASDFPVTAIVSDTTDPQPLALTDAELFSLAEQGPSVRTSASNLRVAELTEKNSKASYWPQITATGSFNRSNQDRRYDFGAGKMGYSWGFGLSANFRIFDGFARENQILSAKISTDNAEANLRESRLTARQNMTQQLNALRTAEETIRLQRFTIVVSEEQLRIANARYENGVGLYQDVLNAQNSLNNARASLTNARVSARNARAQIETLIGRDLPQ
jgi:outer membrane protein TolC